jgi:uncharacterized OsmC-like protein
VVARTGDSLRTELVAGGHQLVADEPKSLGGTDTGPTPYDYLLAALGGCTAMTLRMYADRKGWPLESVTVRLSQERVHATDCEECETEEGRIDRIEREIELEGPWRSKGAGCWRSRTCARCTARSSRGWLLRTDWWARSSVGTYLQGLGAALNPDAEER